MRTEAIDLEDGGQPLLDLRFADDSTILSPPRGAVGSPTGTHSCAPSAWHPTNP